MKQYLLLVFTFLSSVSLSGELRVKKNANLRSSANFIGLGNRVGSIAKDATATILEEVTLPSGNKAYRISLASVKPPESVEIKSDKKDAWIYGSSSFVELDTRAHTEGRVAKEVRCENCDKKAGTEPLQPVRQFVQHVESDGAAMDSSTNVSQDAKAMVESLKKKGIDCDLRNEQIQLRGVQCKGKLAGYPEPVRFYIPKNYVKNGKNKLNIFFHGFEAVTNIFQINPKDRNGAGDFGGRLAEAEDNESIIVVPESRSVQVPVKIKKMVNGVETLVDSYKVDEKTYSKYFQDNTGDNYERFVNQIKEATQGSYATTTLAGHSGGYLPLNGLLGYPKVAKSIKRVALFDGSYNQTTNITQWLNSNSENQMRLSWVGNGSVETQTQAFIARVQRPGQLKQMRVDGTHMDNIRIGGYVDFLKGN